MKQRCLVLENQLISLSTISSVEFLYLRIGMYTTGKENTILGNAQH